MLLNKDQIIAAKDIPSEVVYVEEWGGEVRIRGLSAAERLKYHQSIIKGVRPDGSPMMDTDKASMHRFVALVLVGEDDKPLFTEADLSALGEKSGQVLERLQEVGMRLSGMGAKKEEGKN